MKLLFSVFLLLIFINIGHSQNDDFDYSFKDFCFVSQVLLGPFESSSVPEEDKHAKLQALYSMYSHMKLQIPRQQLVSFFQRLCGDLEEGEPSATSQPMDLSHFSAIIPIKPQEFSSLYQQSQQDYLSAFQHSHHLILTMRTLLSIGISIGVGILVHKHKKNIIAFFQKKFNLSSSKMKYAPRYLPFFATLTGFCCLQTLGYFIQRTFYHKTLENYAPSLSKVLPYPFYF